jgi:hypothetical protein
MTDEAFAALERRLAPVLAEGGRGCVDRHDVLDLLAECRALRRPPDVSGLIPAADLAEMRTWTSLGGKWLRLLFAHIDALEALVRELYGVVSDLHAEDPGRQALLGRGAAEMLYRALALVRESFDDPAAADYPELADTLGLRLRALGPARPPLPPSEAEREAERLRGALLACVRAVGQVTRAEPAGSMGGLIAAYEAARAALGGGVR